MPAFLLYEIKVAVAMAVFYMFYRLLLRKETFHRFNRAVLVGTVVLSFVLPLCIITIHRPVEMEAAPATVFAPEEGIIQDLVPTVEASAPWWPVALTILFWLGVAFVLARVVLSILSIGKIVRQGKQVREEDGCRIIVTERELDPFSWMKYIVLSSKDWEGPHDSILAHEKAHIRNGHSVELLLVDILSAFQWFNPAIWMLRADLQELHEYEADNAVLHTGADIKEYQYLLIRKAVSKSGYSVANSFNHSILKNRITMMSKSKSPLARGLRALYVLPLVCLGLGLQAQTVYVPVDKDSENLLSDERPDEKKKGVLEEIVVVKYADASVKPEDIRHGETKSAFSAVANPNVDTPPVFSEGNFSMWLNSRLVFPKDCLYDGTVVIGFTVSESGRVEEVKVLRGVHEALDSEVMEKVAKSPSWTPATLNGKAVAFRMMMPVHFMIRVPKASGTANQPSQSALFLNVKPDGKEESGGKVYELSQLKDLVGSNTGTVQISATKDVPLGVIDDVKEELRKLNVKIRFVLDNQEGRTPQMPPFPSPKKAKESVYPEEILPGVARENIFVVRINNYDKIFFGDSPSEDDAEMLQKGKDFLRKHGRETRFSLMADRGTSYGAYTHMQNLLMKIYEDIRNEKALELYGKPLSELTPEDRSQINFQVPYSISEAALKGK